MKMIRSIWVDHDKWFSEPPQEKVFRKEGGGSVAQRPPDRPYRIPASSSIDACPAAPMT